MCSVENSHLNILTNKVLTSITFIWDYLQLSFDETGLTLYNYPNILRAREVFSLKIPGYRDLFCSLIGKKVVKVEEVPKKFIRVYFDADIVIEVSLLAEMYNSPEIAMLTSVGNLIVVW